MSNQPDIMQRSSSCPDLFVLARLRSEYCLPDIVFDQILDCPADTAVHSAVLSDVNSDHEEDSNAVNDDELGEFMIPELPEGSQLNLSIRSNWGDPTHVGLTGLEIIGIDGSVLRVEKSTLKSKESCNSPDVITDGTFHTKDESHMWLSAFHGSPVDIEFTLTERSKIALIRIWNYNKSRIHSTRGAKDLYITLDDCPIFEGQLSKAPGSTQDFTGDNYNKSRIHSTRGAKDLCITLDDCPIFEGQLSKAPGSMQDFTGDTILFTTDEDILERVFEKDWLFTPRVVNKDCDDQNKQPTRPHTRDELSEKVRTEELPSRTDVQSSPHLLLVDGERVAIKGREFKLELCENWGSPEVIGLRAIRLVDKSGRNIPIDPESIACSVPSPNLYRLLDLQQRSIEEVDQEGFCCHFDAHLRPSIRIFMDNPTSVAEIHLWNLNDSLELSYAGVKRINVFVDGKMLLPGVLLRKAPGNTSFNYVQRISAIEEIEKLQARSRPSAYRPGLPFGYIFQLQLLSTWGDPYYVGMNGIEFYGSDGKLIKITEKELHVIPESVNVLSDVKRDVRTSDKLIDGVNATRDPHHSWLAPLFPSLVNRIYVVFSEPTILTKATLWNYAKTPERGVREFTLLVDDLIVYSDMLPCTDQNDVGMMTITFGRDDPAEI